MPAQSRGMRRTDSDPRAEPETRGAGAPRNTMTIGGAMISCASAVRQTSAIESIHARRRSWSSRIDPIAHINTAKKSAYSIHFAASRSVSIRCVLGMSEMRIAATTAPKAMSSGRAARISGKRAQSRQQTRATPQQQHLGQGHRRVADAGVKRDRQTRDQRGKRIARAAQGQRDRGDERGGERNQS